MPCPPIERQVPDPEVGLCSACKHAAVQRSAKGSAFWRCRAADAHPQMLRYPPLPVSRCAVFEGGVPAE